MGGEEQTFMNIPKAVSTMNIPKAVSTTGNAIKVMNCGTVVDINGTAYPLVSSPRVSGTTGIPWDYTNVIINPTEGIWEWVQSPQGNATIPQPATLKSMRAELEGGGGQVEVKRCLETMLEREATEDEMKEFVSALREMFILEPLESERLEF